MKYIPAYERYSDEEDKNKLLVYQYKNGAITTKGEPTHANHSIEHMAVLTITAGIIPKLIPHAENIELTYIPTAHEMNAKFNVGEQARDFVMKTVSNGFLLYSTVEIPATDVLTRMEGESSDIEFYEDYPFTYYIPTESVRLTKFILDYSESKDITHYPCLLIKQEEE